MKRLITIITTIILILSMPFKTYAIDMDEKIIRTFVTSSDISSFPDTLPYEDSEGFTGIYEKVGEPYVVSGSDADSKTITLQDSNSVDYFSPQKFHSDGSYSGFLNFIKSERLSKSVDGIATIDEVYNQTCIRGGKLFHNTSYDPKTFSVEKPITWEYYEYDSIWTDRFVKGLGDVNVSSSFNVDWNGINPRSATYNDGVYNGYINIMLLSPLYPVWQPVYSSHPGNGYIPSYSGQEVQVGTITYRYSLLGTVFENSYKGYYSGTVYKEDDRVWRQDYKGIAENLQVQAEIERVLEPHTPNFKGGEKGVLKITIKGRAEKLKISFPFELAALDGSLNKEINLSGNSTEIIKHEFFVPLEAKSGNYNVEVKVYKKDREKSAYPSFRVGGKITDNLRTRIR